MMMPSMVRKVRMRCASMARHAMVAADLKRSSVLRHAETCVISSRVLGAAVGVTAAMPVSGVTALSEITFPSRSSMIRLAFAATLASWVTIITV